MLNHAFTLTRYDPDRPWIVVSTDRMTVELDDSANFLAWALERFPGRNERAVEVPGRPPGDRPGAAA